MQTAIPSKDSHSGFRIEHDALGIMSIPNDCLWGIHTARALENFSLAQRPIHAQLIRSYAYVKWACAQTNYQLGFLSQYTFAALRTACEEMASGHLSKAIVVDAWQGGAGTSTNMNINEVLANRSLQILDLPLGSYETIHPIETVNLHQSTNDTYPTAIKVAALFLMQNLEQSVISLLETLQGLEQRFSKHVKTARTQYQDAVLTTVGRSFGAYADAIARDRWRISKCHERLRVINLGGTAIGTGLGAPKQYIFKVVDQLNEITNLNLSRAENLVEATQNTDVFVEVHGIIKALAATLAKIAGDLRFLSSGPDSGIAELILPARQAGSSIMPHKINPVLPEAMQQLSMVIAGHDQQIYMAASQGHLELNPFLPLIADAFLHSLSSLAHGIESFTKYCLQDIQVNETQLAKHTENSVAIATLLSNKLGYDNMNKYIQEAKQTSLSLKEYLITNQLISQTVYESLISPQQLHKLGEA